MNLYSAFSIYIFKYQFFTNSVWIQLRPTGLCEQLRVVRRGLRFIVLICEDLKV